MATYMITKSPSCATPSDSCRERQAIKLMPSAARLHVEFDGDLEELVEDFIACAHNNSEE